VRPFEINLSAFASEIRHPLNAEYAPQPGRVVIVNNREPLRIRGAELLVGGTIGETHLLFNSTYLDATEESPGGGRRAAELMPELSAEIAAKVMAVPASKFLTPARKKSTTILISPPRPRCSKSTRWRNGISARSRCS
jgi:hypothetical protein